MQDKRALAGLPAPGSTRATFEDRATVYETMAEALPRLRELERAQIATAAMLKAGRN